MPGYLGTQDFLLPLYHLSLPFSAVELVLLFSAVELALPNLNLTVSPEHLSIIFCTHPFLSDTLHMLAGFAVGYYSDRLEFPVSRVGKLFVAGLKNNRGNQGCFLECRVLFLCSREGRTLCNELLTGVLFIYSDVLPIETSVHYRIFRE